MLKINQLLKDTGAAISCCQIHQYLEIVKLGLIFYLSRWLLVQIFQTVTFPRQNEEIRHFASSDWTRFERCCVF